MSKYILQPAKKDDLYWVIQINNGIAVKKLGPYPKFRAVSVQRMYQAQDDAVKKQLEAHKNQEKGEPLSQAEALEFIKQIKDSLNRIKD